ncbi:MAG: DUF2127 domain-containing protein [Terracidiphilus sp.]|nr:DUF2127 domain-containing protein [Terracidiphilus sp.]
MTQSKPESNPNHHHNSWLLLIALYKLLQALLIAAIGFGALHLLGRDVADELSNLADRLHFNSEGRLVDYILDKAQFLSDPLLRRIGATAFCYAALSLAEGIGLYLEKAWGEYLTLLITASFLPWELIEVVHRLTLVRVSLLSINILVFVYLLKLVTDRKQKRALADQTDV